MNISKLETLLKKREYAKLDFKRDLNLKTAGDKKELAKDISAIGNSRGGRGYIIFGVEDKTKDIVGIKKDDLLEEKIQQIIANRLDPPIPIKIEYIHYKNKYVGVLTIFRSIQKPHQLRQNGTFYIRRGSTTDVARRFEVASMFEEAGFINSELIPIYDSSIKDLNLDILSDYLKKINIHYKITNELLVSMGILKKQNKSNYCLTLGGLLLFSDYPQKYLNHANIRIIIHYDDKKYIKVFKGNLIFMLDKSEAFLQDLFKYNKYPLRAILEALRNAIVHRDYLDKHREIIIYISKTKVEISNPGILINGDTKNTIIKEKNNSRRNNWIYQKILIMDDKKRYLESGLGILRIKESFKNKKTKIKFLNIDSRNLFKVILPGVKLKI
ncbi:MAG: putative DNA binding domain-containing protein [Peptostreptococcaceae bacterium]|jgi:predicted HTH transcriptional regulator|nr:putative DNA binding domain-containing protein [Peptostreptococcaceae bacterium]